MNNMMITSRLKKLTRQIIDKRSKQLKDQQKELVSPKDVIQALSVVGAKTLTNIKVDISAIKNNRRVLASILSTVRNIQKAQTETKVAQNKTDTVKDPLSLFRKRDGASGAGLLGALGLGFSIISKIFGALAKPVVKIIGKAVKLIARIATRIGLLGGKVAKKAGETILDWIKKRKKGAGWKVLRKEGIKQSVKRIGARVVASGLGRAATQIVVRLGISAAAAIGGATSAIGVGIGLLASAVGYGTYKLASWLNVYEKLNGLISKVTNNKYRDLADIMMAVTSGQMKDDITKWLKENALTFFKSGYDYIKNKISGLLEKLNPFSAKDKVDAVDIKASGTTQKQALENQLNDLDTQEAGPDTTQPGNTGIVETAKNALNTMASASPMGSMFSAMSSAVSSFGGGNNNGESGAGILENAKNAVVSGVSNVVDSVKGAVSGFMGSSETSDSGGTGSGLTHFPSKIRSVNSVFGMRLHPVKKVMRMHSGVDLPLPAGTSVFSAASGTVSYTKTRGGYGKTVEVDHGNGLKTLYAHLSSYAVQAGQKVSGGQLIAKSGNTGLSSGPHLHFEVSKNGVKQNPAHYLKFTGKAAAQTNKKTGKGGPSDIAGVSGLPRTLSGALSASRTHSRTKGMQSHMESPRMPQDAPGFNLDMNVPTNTATQNSGTTETQPAQVESPRIVSPSINLVTHTALYT